jgi:hypothetical protein
MIKTKKQKQFFFSSERGTQKLNPKLDKKKRKRGLWQAPSFLQ